MSTITSLKDVVSEIGNIVTLNYAGNNTWEVDDSITGSLSNATGYIVQVNTDARKLWIIPTSDLFFQDMENIVGVKQITPALLLPSELTWFTKTEKSIKTWIEDKTNRKYGATEQLNIKETTEIKQRFYKLPNNIVSVDSVTLNGVLLTVDDDYYVKDSFQIDFFKEMDAPPYPNNLLITYTDGTTVVPSSISLAANIMLVELWTARNHNNDMKGANSLSFGGKSVSFTKPVHTSELDALLPLVATLLKSKSRFILL